MEKYRKPAGVALVLAACVASASAGGFSVKTTADRIGDETGIAVPGASAAKTPEVRGTVAADTGILPVEAFGGTYELTPPCPVKFGDPYYEREPQGLSVTVPTSDSIHVETAPSLFSEPWWFDGGTLRDIRGINGPAKTYKGRGAKCSELVFGLCDKEVKFKDTQVAYTTSDSLVFYHEQTGNFELFWILRFLNDDRSALTYEFRSSREHDYKHPERGSVIAACTLKRI